MKISSKKIDNEKPNKIKIIKQNANNIIKQKNMPIKKKPIITKNKITKKVDIMILIEIMLVKQV